MLRSAVSQLVVGAVLSAGPEWSMWLTQVDEGETQVVNIREADSRLGPLVYGLAGLGAATFVATVLFWWLTRPSRGVDDAPESAAP